MLNEIINLINPDNKDLNNLTSKEMLELLTRLNKRLRHLDESENVIEENMVAGDLVSPTKEVQTKTLEYLTKNMQKVQNKKAKASMVYYILLNLHMFSDGNGRISRFMYDLISGELCEENISYYFHENANNSQEPKRNLEETKGILDISVVNRIPDELLSKKLKFVPEEILENYNWITVGHTHSSPSTDSIIPKPVLAQLSQKELQDLDKILRDGYGMQLCPSGLAMLYVSNQKGQLDNWINTNTNNLKCGIGIQGRLNFSVYKNSEMIANWGIEDFRDLITVGNAVKYARLKCLIDVFIEPTKYINMDTGNTYADDILEIPKTKENDSYIK